MLQKGIQYKRELKAIVPWFWSILFTKQQDLIIIILLSILITVAPFNNMD